MTIPVMEFQVQGYKISKTFIKKTIGLRGNFSVCFVFLNSFIEDFLGDREAICF